MSKKLSTSELLRLACIYAETDREAMLDAIANTNDEEEKNKIRSFLKQLKDYRKKRWGETELEFFKRTTPSVPVHEIFKRKP